MVLPIKLKPAMLRCDVEKVEPDLLIISTEQFDYTPMYGAIPRKGTETEVKDGKLVVDLEVTVIKEGSERALISWPVICFSEVCPGDEFWVNKDRLVKKGAAQ